MAAPRTRHSLEFRPQGTMVSLPVHLVQGDGVQHDRGAPFRSGLVRAVLASASGPVALAVVVAIPIGVAAVLSAWYGSRTRLRPQKRSPRAVRFTPTFG